MPSTVRVSLLPWVSALLLVGGCEPATTGVDAGAPTPGMDAGGPVAPDAEAGDGAVGALDAGTAGDVTYYGQVRPILTQHCVSCHSYGGIAPLPLDSYDSAQAVATLVANATAERRMPPFLVDNSGACHTFSDARWLSADEIATLRAWDEAGEPMGDPATPAPDVVAPSVLDGVVSTIATMPSGAAYAVDTSRSDDYRCFVVDAPASFGAFVTGYQVHPGNPAVVHHVIVYAPADAASATAIRRNDAADPAVGYPCFGGVGSDAFPVVLWAPGGGATNFPSGTGVQLDATLPLVIQVHYNTAAGAGTDRTTVDLETAATVTRARIIPILDAALRLPPRMASVTTTHTENLADLTRGFTIPLTIYGTFPHMHNLGRTLRVDRLTAGTEECLVDVPRWDFNWQLAYFYETPIRMTSADSIRITCGYDTTSRTDTVTWGENTQDEMCLAFFYMVVGAGL